jgi:hypothetical protein
MTEGICLILVNILIGAVLASRGYVLLPAISFFLAGWAASVVFDMILRVMRGEE